MIKIDILLSTFNGERHLPELLDSLLNQTVQNFRLIIRDDHSQDNTLKVLDEYKDRFSDITIISGKKNLGPAKSFIELIKKSEADYIFLCDQDDIWLNNKLNTIINILKRYENKNGKSFPLLIHSDLFITDESLNVLSPSYYVYMGHSPKRVKPYQIALQNNIVGCSIAFNRALLQKALPIPDEVVMHDWWLALVASLTGKIIFDPNPLVLYRQHDSNTVGARKTKNHFKRLVKMLPFSDNQGFTSYFEKVFLQAEMAFKRYQFQTTVEKAEKLESLLLLRDLTFLPRAVHILSEGFFRHTFLESIELLLRYKI